MSGFTDGRVAIARGVSVLLVVSGLLVAPTVGVTAQGTDGPADRDRAESTAVGGAFDSVNGTVQVRPSWINVTANGAPAACTASVALDSVEQLTPNGSTVAREAGGVWRRPAENGSVVTVTPPAVSYRNGTLSLPTPATRSVGESGSGLRTPIPSTPACRNPQTLTVRVHSPNYRGWARFLERETPASPVVDRANRTASVVLSTGGPTVETDPDPSVHIATVEVVAIDSAVRTGDASTRTSFDHADLVAGESPPDVEAALNHPVTARLFVNGTAYTPWPDAPGANRPDPRWTDDIDPYGDDLNDPSGEDPAAVSTTLGPRYTISVGMTRYECESDGDGTYDDPAVWENVSASASATGGEAFEVGDDSTRYYQYRCGRSGADGPAPADAVHVRASPEGTTNNVLARFGGDRLPVTNATTDAPVFEALADRRLIDPETNTVTLPSNAALFLYELDVTVTGSSGQGDDSQPRARYDDGAVLVTFRERATVPRGHTLRVTKEPTPVRRVRDVDGDGTVTYADVVTLFERIDAEPVAASPLSFDYNENGRVDFADLVALFRRVVGG